MRWLSHRAAACLSMVAVAAITPSAQAGHGHCHHNHKCAVCCCPPAAPAERAVEERQTRRARDSVVRAAVIPSMPMYTMPMMYAAMPMMPAVATQPTRAVEPRGPDDCCERVRKLEEQMLKLATAVNEMQEIVAGQTRAIDKLTGASPK